jgi:4-amino-4-deoxy-L-arabinose transferase-like glycosyltransferase
MSARPSARPLPRFVVATAIVVALAHVAVNLFGPYGFHRDEFLYLAMGERLQLWRMDFPPFIAIVANVQRALFGDALWSVRLFPAITGSLLLLAAVHAANRFRAMYAPASAEQARDTTTLLPHMVLVAMLASGVFMRPPNMFQPVIFDQLWWTLALLALLERVNRDDRRWWMGVGAALGLGLLTKFSIAFIGVGIVVGVLLTPLRTDLLTRWPWLALLLALVVGSPSLVGQVALDWPITWQMRDLAAEQLGRRSILAFLGDQFGLVGPLGMVFAAGGWWWLMRAPNAQPYRALGIATAVSWLLLIAQRGKGYYGAPVYPLLFAAAAAAVSGWLAQAPHRSARRRMVVGLMGLNVLFGVIGLPLTLPIASPAFTAAYAQKL